jgi:hypothetical protein
MQTGFPVVLTGSVSIMIGSFTLIVCLSKEERGARNTGKWGASGNFFILLVPNLCHYVFFPAITKPIEHERFSWVAGLEC